MLLQGYSAQKGFQNPEMLFYKNLAHDEGQRNPVCTVTAAAPLWSPEKPEIVFFCVPTHNPL